MKNFANTSHQPMKNIQKASIRPMKNIQNKRSDIKSVFYHISLWKTSQTYCINLWKTSKKHLIQPMKNIKNKHSDIKFFFHQISLWINGTQIKHNIKPLDNPHDKFQCSTWCLWHLVSKVMVGTHLFKTISHNRNGYNWQWWPPVFRWSYSFLSICFYCGDSTLSVIFSLSLLWLAAAAAAIPKWLLIWFWPSGIWFNSVDQTGQ